MTDNQRPSRSTGRDRTTNRYSSQSAGQYSRSSSRYSSSGRTSVKAEQATSSRLRALLPFIAVVAIAAIVLLFAVSSCTATKEQDEAALNGPAATMEAGRIVMQVNGDKNTYVKQGEDYIESGARAFDKKEGFLTDDIKTSGKVDTSKTGDYEITYTVRNSENMENSIKRTVHVVDNMDVDTDGISVLMYHYIYDESAPPEHEDANYLSNTKFEAELKWLSENDYYYPSFKELNAYLKGTHSLPQKSVILTFDDGEEGFLKYGTPLLNKYQIPATSYIIGSDGAFTEKISTYMSEYVNFQSHTYDLHRDGESGKGQGGKIWDLDQEQLVADCNKQIEQLQDHQSLAYPYGDCPEFAPAALEQCGYDAAFTVKNNQVHVGDNVYALPRVRMFGASSLEGFIYQVQHGVE